VLGDAKYEHAQNVLLQKILNASLSLQSSGETLAAGGGDGKVRGRRGADGSGWGLHRASPPLT
jgi:hypothetical protein